MNLDKLAKEIGLPEAIVMKWKNKSLREDDLNKLPFKELKDAYHDIDRDDKSSKALGTLLMSALVNKIKTLDDCSSVYLDAMNNAETKRLFLAKVKIIKANFQEWLEFHIETGFKDELNKITEKKLDRYKKSFKFWWELYTSENFENKNRKSIFIWQALRAAKTFKEAKQVHDCATGDYFKKSAYRKMRRFEKLEK